MKSFESSKISQTELDFVGSSLGSSKWQYSLRTQFITYHRLQYIIDGAQAESTSNQQIFSKENRDSLSKLAPLFRGSLSFPSLCMEIHRDFNSGQLLVSGQKLWQISTFFGNAAG